MRKITFPMVGVEQGSRVWRNAETGVEIIKGKNFAEVGLYYICVPVRAGHREGFRGRRMVDHRNGLKSARLAAEVFVKAMRVKIAEAITEARTEDMERDGRRIVHYRSPELGYQACGEMFSWERMTEVRGKVTCQRCRGRYNSDYWEQATEGMPRVSAFG